MRGAGFKGDNNISNQKYSSSPVFVESYTLKKRKKEFYISFLLILSNQISSFPRPKSEGRG